MKNHLKTLSLTLVLTLAFFSCSKEEIPKPVIAKLVSIKYTPNKIEGKVKKAFKGSSVIVNPKKVNAIFKISKILKDKKTLLILLILKQGLK